MLSAHSPSSTDQDIINLKRAFLIASLFTLLLWLLKGAEHLSGISLSFLGVQPKTVHGLIGLITAPLVHGSVEHLLTNTPTLIILGTAILYAYPRSCWMVIPIIWIGSEIGVWMTARPAYHFGASILTYGFMFFIFTIGILRKDKKAIALSLLVFFLYGTMIWGIFPHQSDFSYESHAWGAGIGIICAWMFRKTDPMPLVKLYDWENTDKESS